MKMKAIVLALVLLVLIVSNASAAVNALELPRYVISAGGGRVTAGNYVLEGTIGQPVAGVVSQGNFDLCSGFWCSSNIPTELLKIFMPFIMK